MINKYGFVRVGAAVPKIQVADVEYNTQNIIEEIKKAEDKGIQILAFPELAITSYSCEDLFNQDILINKAEKCIIEILEQTKNLNIISIIGAPVEVNNQLYDCAVVIQKGKILGIIPKSNVSETRWFKPGINMDEIEYANLQVPFGVNIVFKSNKFKEISFAIEIGEDLLVINQPSNNHVLNGANIIFNLSAINELAGRNEYIKDLIKVQSAKTISGYVYASAGVNESTTNSVMSGYATILETGKVITENERFNFENNLIYTEIDVKKINSIRKKSISYTTQNNEENLYKYINVEIIDNIENLTREYEKMPFVPRNSSKRIKRCEEILNIQSAGLAKRLLYTKCKKIVIGISGGLDSTLAFLVTVKAYKMLGLDNKDIIAITMPGFGTTQRTKNNSINLIKLFGAETRLIDIKEACLQHFKDIDHNIENLDITYENAQARERMQILMDIANKENGLVVGTGDLSELALGWCTFNGDHMSMYSVNAGVPKTLMKFLIKTIVIDETEEIKNLIEDILNTPISPELLPPKENGEMEQLTENNVGPYILSDFFLYHFMSYGAEPEKIKMIAMKTFKNIYTEDEINKWIEIFFKRFFTQQFKRNCIPDGPKIGTVSLSPRGDWQMPSDAQYKIWIE